MFSQPGGIWAYWENRVDKGCTRAGFAAERSINRHDFNVNRNSALDRGGLAMGNEVYIAIDVEALQDHK